MRRKTDYKDNKVIDLKNYIPQYVRNRMAEGITSNLLNRFLTKTDFAEFNGYVGQESFDSELNRIPERTQFRDKNQLQPIINAEIATEKYHLTFEDFLRRLKRGGVDVESFDDWGKSQQFNWVPPIDIDKLVNFRNYYWQGESQPEYITIKNRNTVQEAFFQELKLALFNASNEKVNVDSAQDIPAAASSEYVLMYDFSLNRAIIARIDAANLEEVEQSSNFSDPLFVNEFINLSVPVNSFIDANTFVVSGNYEDAGIDGYLISMIDGNEEYLAKVIEVSYDEIQNTTVVSISHPVPPSADILSFHPLIFAEMHNLEFLQDSITPSHNDINTIYDIGKAFYYRKILIGSDTGGTTLGGLEITTTQNFQPLLQSGRNYTLEIEAGSNRGKYKIVEEDTTSNTIFIQGPSRFFQQPPSIPFKIYENVDINSSAWGNVEIVNDQLRVNSVTFTHNISLLQQLVNVSEVVENPWSESNRWVHKNQIGSFSGTVQASIPIIEFDNTIELSNSASVEYQWRYSPTPRHPDTSYRKVDTSPNLLDLQPIEGDEITFISNTEVRVPITFGDLTIHLEEGELLVFDNFNNNDGIYEIEKVEFVSDFGDYYSVITLTTPVADTSDTPEGSRIYRRTTSMGDVTVIGEDHWEFSGIKNITPSGVNEEINPLLNEYVTADFYVNPEGRPFFTIIGKAWQEFTPVSVDYAGPWIDLDSSQGLDQMCLFEDYQEGDIRVYINGVRQYGNFQETTDATNPTKFITAIKFDSDVIIRQSDRVRIEVGEYFRKDLGKRNVSVRFNTTANPNAPQAFYDHFNLVDDRRVEQEKTEINQYPLFVLYDVFGVTQRISNEIFRYKEDSQFPVLPALGKRVRAEQGDFTFEQLLFKEGSDKLLTYKNINDPEQIQSIWKKGNHNEVQIPQQLDDGEWDIPNSWYFNIQHQNRKEITLRQLFRHFNTIIQSQSEIGLGNIPANTYHAITNPNYGVGGTIKEHNDNLDLLASFTLLNNANPVELIQFASSQYQQQLNEATEHFLKTLSSITTSSTTSLVDFIENNDKLDQWFGDSTTKHDGIGIRNMIATSAVIGATESVTPTLIEIGDDIYLRHHDGHVSKVNLPRGTKLSRYRAISTEVVRTNNPNQLPDPNSFNPGDFVTQLLIGSKTVRLFVREATPSWQLVDADKQLALRLLEIEKRLFEVSLEATRYDFSTLNQSKLNAELEKHFFAYFNERRDNEPLINSIYDPGNPFTWNYSMSEMTISPVDGNPYQPGLGSWQAIYEDLYGTAFPHVEPWILQGYRTKPDWWDAEYQNTSTTIDRVWTLNMWNNILNGVVPSGYDLPEGITAVQQYEYVPVNITNSDTVDGIKPDELIPPYWDNAANSNDPALSRAPFSRDNNDVIVNASAPFFFGQLGYKEWEWRRSLAFVYSKLIAAYRLDPMRLIHRIFGNHYVNVNCLQVAVDTENVYSHRNSLFHGEIDNNEIYKINGLFQWFTHFNRYNGFDGTSSEYRDLWKNWTMNLGYLFGNVINTETFDIRSESIDITSVDYDIRFKKTEGLDDFEFKAIDVTVEKMPSILSPNREASDDWIFKLNFKHPRRNNIKLYKPENFPMRRVSLDEFKIYSHPVFGVGINEATNFVEFSYDNVLTFSTPTPAMGGTVGFNAILDGVAQDPYIFAGNTIQTVEDAINAVNSVAIGFRISLVNGNLLVESSDSILITDVGFFNGIAPGVTQNTGTTAVEFAGYFDLGIDAAEYLNIGDEFSIVDSSNGDLDGTYSIRRVIVNSNTNSIRVLVNEDPPQATNTPSGFVVPSRARTLPWETGQEVFFTTTGTLPRDLLDYVPYYIIKVDDYTFKIAENESLAEQGVAIEFQDNGTGTHKVGRVNSTFKPLNGRVDYAWRRHFPDTREIVELTGPLPISTIQTLCDICFGYEDYLLYVGIEADNERLDNSDEDSGRSRSWLLEIEKFIDWAFTFRSLKNQSPVEVTATLDSANNTMIVNGTIPWGTGAEVTVKAMPGALMPQEVAFSTQILPLYVIRNQSTNSIQFAVSFEDALRGNAINLSTGTGEFLIVNYKNVRNRPVRTVNPYIRQFAINHELGLPSNFLSGENLDVVTAQKICDDRLELFTEKELKFFRKDRYSVVKLLESVDRDIGGGHIFLDGIEHAIIFSDYSSDNTLIYDSFIGINTPRFFLEFVKPMEDTQRATISGLVINGDLMTSSIEKAITDMRFYYDVYKSFENEDSTVQVRRSAGYEGRKDYMDALGVSGKSQFIFWKGYIQSKGTKKSLDAFSQHRRLEGITVDEFWAYRLCRFGDDKKFVYPEMFLTTDDVSRKELRLEFVPPTGGTLGFNFTPVRLTERERWRNLPDIVKELKTSEGYFFTTAISGVMENAENELITSFGRVFVKVDFPALGFIVTYIDVNGDNQIALENTHYNVINLSIIEFVASDFNDWSNIKIVGITYNYDAEHPSKIIDVSRLERVVADVPIWNPAFGQHNPIGRYPIEITGNDDPAKYNNSLQTNSLDFWAKSEVGKVWFDDTLTSYLPYFDKNVYPSLDGRSERWGKLADFGDINLYQWVETSISPEEWDERAEEDESDQSLPMSQRVTGNVRKLLYRNVAGNWIQEKNIVIPMTTLDFSFARVQLLTIPLQDYLIETGQSECPVSVYVNGKLLVDDIFENFNQFTNLLTGLFANEQIQLQDYVTIVKKIPIPTDEEIEDGDFIYSVPHTVVKKFNNKKQLEELVYYYWVQDLKNEKLIDNTSLTLFDARIEMKNMTRPFMFLEGLQTSDIGYGVLFGSTFDPDDNALPTRFTQCIVKGLKNTVKDNNRYVLRFVKNFALRDKLNDADLALKNVHWEWKLIRRNQPGRIDRVLWDKVVESACGFALNEHGSLDTTITLPSFERVTYDRFIGGGATRIGLRRGQVILDREPLLELLLAILLDPNRNFENVDILEFVASYNLEDVNEIFTMLNEIYETFQESEINDIFFEILEESMIVRKQHPDFLKTSWVAIDVEARVDTNPRNIIKVAKTFPSDKCFL